MSDLKYQTVEQLEQSERSCLKYIGNLKNNLEGQRVRPHWIQKYIFEKSPQELSIEQIEQALGHKVIIKESK